MLLSYFLVVLLTLVHVLSGFDITDARPVEIGSGINA